MPHSLSPTLPLVNNCLRHPRLHLSFAPPRLSPRRRLSFASLTPLAHSQCSYARSRPRSLWLHGLLSGVSNKKHVDLLFHSYKNITMIFYYKIDFVIVADIAFKINHVGSYGVAIAPISARSLWSHAWTLARLPPRSLSPTLPLVNNCLRHPRLHLSFAPLTPLAHSLCLYARSRPRSLWLHGLYVVSLTLRF